MTRPATNPTEREPFTPPDLESAYRAWAANCGPAAFAAIVRRPLREVREFFPSFPRRPWLTPSAMKEALDKIGARYKDTSKHFATRTPLYGLVFVQIAGPWTKPGANAKWAYKYTHWVGVAGGRRYDANVNGWLPESEWRTSVMAQLVKGHDRATGFYDRLGIEVIGLPKEEE